MSELSKGKIPVELDFFVGGENIDLQNQVIQLGADEDGLELLSYLQTDDCAELIRENKIKIHIETCNLFFDNENSNESIYDLFSCTG